MEVSEIPKAIYDEINIDNLILKAKNFKNQNSTYLVESARTIKSPWNSELPPVFDNVMIQDYVEGIVGDYLSEDTTIFGLRKNSFSEHENANDNHNIKAINVNEAAVDNQLNISTELALLDEDIQIEWEPIIRSLPPKIPPKKIMLPISPGTTRTTEFRKKCIQDSNSNRNSCKILPKTPRVQYSLFTGNAKGFTTINFSKEHPDLGLDSSHESNTLFPRRYAIKPQEELSNLLSKERSPLNILDTNKLETEIEIPIDKTWREELLTKKPRRKIKKKKIKVKAKTQQVLMENPNVESSLPELLELEPATIQIESILTPLPIPNEQITQSLQLNESNEMLLNSAPKTQESLEVIYDTPIDTPILITHVPTFSQIKNKFQIKNFPVLCIRGAFKIQKVVSISIEGDSCKKSLKTENSINRNNVQYVEYIHKDKKVDFIPVETQSEGMKCDSQNATLQYENHSKDLDDVQSNENNASVIVEQKFNKFYQPFKDMTNLISQDEALSKSKFITTVYSSSKEFTNSPINSNSTSDLSCYSSSTEADKNFKELKAKRIVRKRKPSKGLITRDITFKKKDISSTEDNCETYLQKQPQTLTTQLPIDIEGCELLYEENKQNENDFNSSEDARNILNRVLTLPERKQLTLSDPQNDKWNQVDENNEENNDNNFNSTTKLGLPKNCTNNKKQNEQYLDEIFQQIENGELVCLKTFKDRHKEQLHRSNSSSAVKFTEIADLNVVAPYLPLKAKQCFDIEEYNCCLYSRPVTERNLNLPPSDKALLYERIKEPRRSSTSSSDLGINLDEFTSGGNTSNRNHKSSFQEFNSENHVNYERTLNSFRTSHNSSTQKRNLSSSSDPEVQTAVSKFIQSLYSPNAPTKLDNLDCTYLLRDKVKTNHNCKSSGISFSSSHLTTNRSHRKRKTFLASEPVLSSSTVSLLTTFKEVTKSNKKITHFPNSDKCLGNNSKNKNTEPLDLELKPSLVHSKVDYDSNLISSSLSSISLNLDLSQLKETSSSSSSKKLTSWKQLTKSSKTFSCNSDASGDADGKTQISSGVESCNFSKLVSPSMSEGEILSLGEV